MPAAPLLVTGANGHLGRDLIRAVGGTRPIRAAVRSERAAAILAELPEALRPEVHILDYADEAALRAAGEGCSAWIHLVGILKESQTARYEDAHERTCEVLARAAEKAGAERIVYMSILGADPASRNACLASKARAEGTLSSGATPATTLRVPMVLGPNEIAAGALLGQASAPVSFLTRGGATREQPIDARDVVAAILAAANEQGSTSGGLDLAGPESLTHRELVMRVAALLGKSPRIVPLPLVVLRGIASLLERVASAPPITRAMLGVLEHDDDIDPGPACRRLGLELTPLADTLQHTFAPAADLFPPAAQEEPR
ncbi:MAG: NAD(P)H-binding protein [Deltaproteobacteria bacterium]|nr:NAD(P)H-binding protein [Deltaproteobacteria bacterium]